MISRHPPVSHIAGVLAAKEGLVPSHELAAAIMARLDREGFAIVPRDQAGAVAALQALDGILALRDAAGDEELVTEWAEQLGHDSPARLTSALVAVRNVLDQGTSA
ncbi:hypothetical protein [Methylorubrum extorquens]|jgi:hypothetical protein|uniref:Uncharacterized protein n=1 Tax=Methylorubrum extorquens (strain ATCC 14718 / DSM 1338 / JCM 2805 / NCIMB 9133 / AM1) TaxID=272630 RepID=C5AYK0_METEA|nr:hypothetical protein [Methylorubrum extorquens]ACS39116.1 Hypothetical protein MexAM1_META1p1252 [Methylorubrum extorquens AM1]MCP1542778.1 hypothetical protein [Methylorubrum extorquens]MCP1589877.1 hypothetical protein [Methylorubrum extorquens]